MDLCGDLVKIVAAFKRINGLEKKTRLILGRKQMDLAKSLTYIGAPEGYFFLDYLVNHGTITDFRLDDNEEDYLWIEKF